MSDIAVKVITVEKFTKHHPLFRVEERTTAGFVLLPLPNPNCKDWVNGAVQIHKNNTEK